MTTRYYEETPCEHGRMQAHGVVGVIHGEGVPECNGGKRQELTGVETVDTGWHPLKTFGDGPGVYIKPGRYVIIPIP